MAYLVSFYSSWKGLYEKNDKKYNCPVATDLSEEKNPKFWALM